MHSLGLDVVASWSYMMRVLHHVDDMHPTLATGDHIMCDHRCYMTAAILSFLVEISVRSPENHIFSLSVKIISGFKISKNLLFNFENGSTNSHHSTPTHFY